MKRLLLLCLLFLASPFLNALLFVPPITGDTTLNYPHRQISFVAKRMIYSDYQFFDNGVIRVGKGIYGYLFGTLYIFYIDKTYSYIPKEVHLKDQYEIDFENKGRTFATATVKRIPDTQDKAILKIRFPGPGNDGEYRFSEATIHSELAFKSN